MAELVDVQINNVEAFEFFVNVTKSRGDARGIVAGYARVLLLVQAMRQLTMSHLVVVVAFTQIL